MHPQNLTKNQIEYYDVLRVHTSQSLHIHTLVGVLEYD